MIYRGSENGFRASEFHQKCNEKGATLIIVRSEFNKIFGGFTDIYWTSPDDTVAKNQEIQIHLFFRLEKIKILQYSNA